MGEGAEILISQTAIVEKIPVGTRTVQAIWEYTTKADRENRGVDYPFYIEIALRDEDGSVVKGLRILPSVFSDKCALIPGLMRSFAKNTVAKLAYHLPQTGDFQTMCTLLEQTIAQLHGPITTWQDVSFVIHGSWDSHLLKQFSNKTQALEVRN